ncbi:MAG TPA: FAD-dependent monooxygenase [Vicinamibacterales bacterium]|nr:FAD-dependent monooxygenase [Vicinamibacterales bacterium]
MLRRPRITPHRFAHRAVARPASADVFVIGGGPAGAVAAKLLAEWGHRVRLVTRPLDPSRSLANSLPPSTHKLLAQTGIADLVDRIGYRTSGNTVWWGERDGAVAPFSADASAWGFQIDRARLDPLLHEAASRAGVEVETDARVTRIDLEADGVTIAYERPGAPMVCAARIVLDCSGRSGALAVPHRLRQHVAGGRMQALVGVWERHGGWFLQNPSHTFIETCHEGWAWSLPTSDTVRHVGIMVDGATSRVTRGPSLEATYRTQLALTRRIDRQVGGSTLLRVFACDASVYSARTHAGPGFALVGDAGSTLNPLSSFGVKKALASAWLAAVVANTCIAHPDRAAAATDFFTRWEAGVWQVNLKRSRDFAAEALRRHPSAFWQTQASAAVDEAQIPADDAAMLGAPAVRAALHHLRAADTVLFRRNPERTFVCAPLVRGTVIAIEEAVPLATSGPRDARRYVRGIDLVTLATVAPLATDIPVIYEAYCARHGATALPDFLASLSLLVAHDVLRVTAPGVRLP